MEFVKCIEKYIDDNAIPFKGAHVVVGLSGGADSTALLRVLAVLREKLDMELCAVHVHHGIRGAAADADVEFCRKMCVELKVSLEVFYVDVPMLAKRDGHTLEEAGRLARQEIFADVVQRISADGRRCVVALAHHMDDQAETVLMNLARGSSLKGLVGIRPVHAMRCGGGKSVCVYDVVRPLLCVRKRDILEWLSRLGAGHCEDATNAESEHTRNRLRNLIIPRLEEDVNTNAVANIAKLSSELGNIDAYLTKLSAVALEECRRSSDEFFVSLDKKKLAKTPAVLADRLVMDELARIAGRAKDIYSVHVRDVMGLLDSRVGSRISLPYGMEARLGYDEITIGLKERECGLADDEYWTPDGIVVLEAKAVTADAAVNKVEVPVSVESLIVEPAVGFDVLPVAEINNDENICTKYFDYDTIKFDMQIRTRRDGDMLCVYRDGRKKKLNRFFVEQKVPARYRDKVLLVTCGSEVLWVVGIRVSECHKPCGDTRQVCRVRLPLHFRKEEG